ncbi:hypothetical protein CDAR_434941 [Caerostris darwini]|uniref:Uncharacterized protein n=1 Tax=Caerostris darwini TaxID=1538125 RepID=A0AAV4QD82_9ARAC|nr:hypothetical protein CDAR_434941 [Caerostris darwini]
MSLIKLHTGSKAVSALIRYTRRRRNVRRRADVGRASSHVDVNRCDVFIECDVRFLERCATGAVSSDKERGSGGRVNWGLRCRFS